jgi:predicted DNA-binding transcriptional regulator YafY
MNLKRITRLLKLLQTLQAGGGQDADGLAKSCGVSRRTIFRDLETLREAGVPLAFDSQEDRYFIPASFFLPPTNFTPEEALSIIVLASKIPAGEKLPFSEPALQAALKLERSFPAPLREELRNVTRAIEINMAKVSPLHGKAGFYQQLVNAIGQRQVVRIRYASLTEWETIETKLRPYQLLFSGRSWYVIGRSSLHKETRTFNLARIKELSLLKERYSMRGQFDLNKYLGNAWHLVPEAGEDHYVVVRFEPLVAQNVSEVMWHKTQELHWCDDGTLDFHCRVSGLHEIAWWILGYGDQAEVLRPAKLRKLVGQRAANMHRIYSSQS